MALALMFEDSSVLYLDAVTNFQKVKSSNISSHPVDASSLITDHVSKSNPSFTIRAIISAADFHSSITRPIELLEGENAVDTDYNQPVEGAVITSPSSLLDYLPGSIQQVFGGTDNSEVTVDPFRGYSHQIARDRLNAAWDKSELVTILDYDFDSSIGSTVSVRMVEDCIITRYEDTEDVDTGDALLCNLTLQKVRFAYIKEVDVEITQAPVNDGSGIADGASSEEDLGDQTANGEAKANEYVVEDIADFVDFDIQGAINSIKEGVF